MKQKRLWLLAAATKRLGGGSWTKARLKCGITANYRKLRYRRKKTCP